MNKRFNTPEEVREFLDSEEFADGFKQYFVSLLEENQTELHHALESTFRTLQIFGDKLRSIMQAVPTEILESILEVISAGREDYQRYWKVIAKHGWFPHPSMFFSANLLVKLINNDPSGADHILTNLFRDELTSIESELVDLYPNRRHLFEQGFEAHREGKYSLSILMFLAQSDGISKESDSNSVFRKAERKHIGLELKSDERSVILTSFLPLLTDDTMPIWVTERDRDSSFHGFNRHLVMHGESTDYDTEENSLRAASFLSWLAVVLNYAPDVDQYGEDVFRH